MKHACVFMGCAATWTKSAGCEPNLAADADVGKRGAACDADLRLHQVDARHLLRTCVLHLRMEHHIIAQKVAPPHMEAPNTI
jgi:hypothetical protein